MTARKLALVAAAPGASAGVSAMPLADRDDDELMLLVGGGSREAFNELIRRHRPRALGVAMRYLKSSGPAHDAVQNTFLDIYRSAARYRPRGSFPSFLYRALLNQCHMARRAARSEERLLAAAAAREPAARLATETLEDRILADEQDRRIQRALDQLSEKLRGPVVLRYAADLSYQEIAEVLAIPLGTAKRRLFDALEKLRALLVEES
jgi:RNA polymerase sigma-70 factor (ECF subfamily)